jgi:hypothetical protein
VPLVSIGLLIYLLSVLHLLFYFKFECRFFIILLKIENSDGLDIHITCFIFTIFIFNDHPTVTVELTDLLFRSCLIVSFTGSEAVGRIVGKAVQSRFGKVLLELGGNNGQCSPFFYLFTFDTFANGCFYFILFLILFIHWIL